MTNWRRVVRRILDPNGLLGRRVPRGPEEPCRPEAPRDPDPVHPPDPWCDTGPVGGKPAGARRPSTRR